MVMSVAAPSIEDALQSVGISPRKIYYQLSVPELVEHSIKRDMVLLSDRGACVVDTGQFTGRAPKDRFIVKDELTADSVDWGSVNIPLEPEHFEHLLEDMKEFIRQKEVYVRDAYAGADPKYRRKVRFINTYPWHNLFVHHLFIRPRREELILFEPDWYVIALPNFKADPKRHGVPHENFVVINFSKRMVIIGGTAYAGEIKKSIFSVMNFVLPYKDNVLSMHCSANTDKAGNVALFFGLSGTGKTTLSSDPERLLIGDDEHGWTEDGIFNIEGGCYAKSINLDPEKEPVIYKAIRFGTILENVKFFPGTRTVNYADASKTENTRAAYPLYYLDDAYVPSGMGDHPKDVFFLTYDAYGVLPPIARLTEEQAMYYFLLGYTSKVAGTEIGIKEPQPSFSGCFGAPFMPLPHTTYAKMLGERIRKHKVRVWLVNTGLTGGPYGVGKRMSLPHTRRLVRAAMKGELDKVAYSTLPVFNLQIPQHVDGVPDEILNPRNTWQNPDEYDKTARQLAQKFIDHFNKNYADKVDQSILAGGPVL